MAHPNQPQYVPPQDPSAPPAPPTGYGPPAQANGHLTYGQQVPPQYGQQAPAQYGQAGQPVHHDRDRRQRGGTIMIGIIDNAAE
jgi:hypothetical protein